MVAVMALTGCSYGSKVMLTEREAAAVEEADILLEAPDKPYRVIAVVSGIAHSSDFLFTRIRTENAALERLKEEAVEAGADGIVQITRETLEGNMVLPYTPWEVSSASGEEALRSPEEKEEWPSALIESYSVVYRGKAIRFVEELEGEVREY